MISTPAYGLISVTTGLISGGVLVHLYYQRRDL